MINITPFNELVSSNKILFDQNFVEKRPNLTKILFDKPDDQKGPIYWISLIYRKSLKSYILIILLSNQDLLLYINKFTFHILLWVLSLNTRYASGVLSPAIRTKQGPVFNKTHALDEIRFLYDY